MEFDANTVRVPIQETNGFLVASIHIDLSEAPLRQFQHDLLERIRQTRTTGVILDLSGVEIMDAHDFEVIRKSISMAEVMGAPGVLVGLQPGVVSALVDLNANLAGIRAALDLEDAFLMLKPELRSRSTSPVEASGHEQPDVEPETRNE